jgi:hypothetical protein
MCFGCCSDWTQSDRRRSFTNAPTACTIAPRRLECSIGRPTRGFERVRRERFRRPLSAPQKRFQPGYVWWPPVKTSRTEPHAGYPRSEGGLHTPLNLRCSARAWSATGAASSLSARLPPGRTSSRPCARRSASASVPIHLPRARSPRDVRTALRARALAQRVQAGSPQVTRHAGRTDVPRSRR